MHCGRIARRMALLAPLVLLAPACTRRVTDFTILSTKNVAYVGERGRRVSGSDSTPIFLFIPIGRPSVKEATDEAIEAGGGNALVDGVVYKSSWWIPLIYGQRTVTVEGTSVRTTAIPDPPRPRPIP